MVVAVLLAAAWLKRSIRERQLAEERWLSEGHSAREWAGLALAGLFPNPGL